MFNLIFFGSSSYSRPLVTALLNSTPLSLLAIITKPGMERIFQDLVTGTKTKILTTPSLKGAAKVELLKQLSGLKIDLGLVADYGVMIPDQILTLPQRGCINIHFSDLPKYRGASPVQYTILNGEKQTAYSFIEMEAKDEPGMDSGDIVYKDLVELSGTETTNELYHHLFNLAGRKVVYVLTAYLNHELSPTPQDHDQSTFTTPSGKFDRTTLINREDAFITHETSDEQIERAIRAYTPWPKAWTTIEELQKWTEKRGEKLILRDETKKGKQVNLLDSHLDENGFLHLDKLQVEAKKPVGWEDFVNGYFK